LHPPFLTPPSPPSSCSNDACAFSEAYTSVLRSSMLLGRIDLLPVLLHIHHGPALRLRFIEGFVEAANVRLAVTAIGSTLFVPEKRKCHSEQSPREIEGGTQAESSAINSTYAMTTMNAEVTAQLRRRRPVPMRSGEVGEQSAPIHSTLTGVDRGATFRRIRLT
jgi:hypothetical protein